MLMNRRLALISSMAVAAVMAGAVIVRAQAPRTAAFESDIPTGLPTPWTFAPREQAAGAFTFTVFGDRTGNLLPHKLGAVVDEINRRASSSSSAFVMSVGDLIEGYSERIPTLLRMWEDFDAGIGRLSQPFFRTVGNHDVGNRTMQEVYRARFSRDYYHFVYNDVLFLVLSTEDPAPELPEQTRAAMDARAERHVEQLAAGNVQSEGRPLVACERYETEVRGAYSQAFSTPSISEAQAAYFERVIERHPSVKWTFVFMHKPAWREPVSAQFTRIEQRLQGRPYTVIAGHTHWYRHERVRERDYYTVGPSASLRRCLGDRDVDNQLVTVRFDGRSPAITREWLD
jgi:hypothetical protein